jgi:hypothetical protein
MNPNGRMIGAIIQMGIRRVLSIWKIIFNTNRGSDEQDE